MAKPQVTEEDLKVGLSSLCGLGGLGGATPSPRRDSPFGAEFVKRPPPTSPPQVVELTAPMAPEPAAATVAPQVPTTVPSTARVQGEETTAPVVPAPPKEAEEVPASAPNVEKTGGQRPLREKAPPTPAPAAAPVVAGATKMDLYSERVTMVMSADMRDQLTLLASQLQRRKHGKTERITANTLMRVAISVFLEALRPTSEEAPSTEDELYSLTLSKVERKR